MTKQPSELFSWIAPGGMETLTVSLGEDKIWVEAVRYSYSGDDNCLCGLTMDDAKKLLNALNEVFSNRQYEPAYLGMDSCEAR